MAAGGVGCGGQVGRPPGEASSRPRGPTSVWGAKGPGPAGRRDRPMRVRGAAQALTCPCSPPPSSRSQGSVWRERAQTWRPRSGGTGRLLVPRRPNPSATDPTPPLSLGAGPQIYVGQAAVPSGDPGEGCSCLARLPVWPSSLGL